MIKGTVKWFNDKKGYGFISVDGEEDKDVFVHFSGIAGPKGSHKTLREGDKVEFEVVDGAKGDQAVEVKKV